MSWTLPYIKDRGFGFGTQGTWSGTLNLQRSITGPMLDLPISPITRLGRMAAVPRR